jgi:hypothetical protein
MSFLPLLTAVRRQDHEGMLLAMLITVAFLGLLIAMGLLTDRLLGQQADQWARRMTTADEPTQPRAEPQAADPAPSPQHTLKCASESPRCSGAVAFSRALR